MILENQIDDMKLRHKYAKGEDKTYQDFSIIPIDLANQKRFEAKQVHGKGGMDVDAVSPGSQN